MVLHMKSSWLHCGHCPSWNYALERQYFWHCTPAQTAQYEVHNWQSIDLKCWVEYQRPHLPSQRDLSSQDRVYFQQCEWDRAKTAHNLTDCIHNYGFSPISSQECRWLKTSSSAAMATLSHTQWWFVSQKSAGDYQGVVWIHRFPLLGHPPVTGMVSIAPSGRSARQLGLRLVIGYSQLTYTCAYTCRHIHACIHTYLLTHLYTSISTPAIRHLPTRGTVGACYLHRP